MPSVHASKALSTSRKSAMSHTTTTPDFHTSSKWTRYALIRRLCCPLLTEVCCNCGRYDGGLNSVVGPWYRSRTSFLFRTEPEDTECYAPTDDTCNLAFKVSASCLVMLSRVGYTPSGQKISVARHSRCDNHCVFVCRLSIGTCGPLIGYSTKTISAHCPDKT